MSEWKSGDVRHLDCIFLKISVAEKLSGPRADRVHSKVTKVILLDHYSMETPLPIMSATLVTTMLSPVDVFLQIRYT